MGVIPVTDDEDTPTHFTRLELRSLIADSCEDGYETAYRVAKEAGRREGIQEAAKWHDDCNEPEAAELMLRELLGDQGKEL